MTKTSLWDAQWTVLAAGGVGSGRGGSGSGRGREEGWRVGERVLRSEGIEIGRGRRGGSGGEVMMAEEGCLT